MTTTPIAVLGPRLAPIIARLASPFDAERLGCVEAIARILAAHDLDFNDLAEALAPAAASYAADEDVELAALLRRDYSADLTPWESEFLRAVAALGRGISDRQRDKVREIFRQVVTHGRNARRQSA
jgi:hypothetical protein